MRVVIKTSFRTVQTFYFLCKALVMYDKFTHFINDNDSIIVEAHMDNEDIIVVYYLQDETNEKRSLFCFDKNDVPLGDEMNKALVQSIEDAFAEFFI